jgi:hypothetical protein
MPKTARPSSPIEPYRSALLDEKPAETTSPPATPWITRAGSLPSGAPTKVLVTLAVVTVAAMVLVPTSAIGIGIAVIGIVVLAALLIGSPERPTVLHLVTATGIAALLVVAGWRSAEWLAAVCILVAILATGALAFGARSVRDMVVAVLAPVAAAIPTVRWIARGIAGSRLRRPVRNLGAIVRVALVTVVLLVVFGALFAGADATFESLLSDIVPDVDNTDIGANVFLGLVIGGFTAIGIYLRFARPHLADRTSRKSAESWMWAVPTGTVLVLHVAFVATQARAMFGGDSYVQETAGLTYADYARTGFWQLFAVTALTILVVSIAWQRADRTTPVRRVLVGAILGGLCIAALAVVASALHRMGLYMDTFGATRLRVSVMATELWLGAVVIFFLMAGAGLGTRHLPRALGLLTIAAALSFAVYNPDNRIAQANVDRYESTGKIDLGYLATLSPDATPALLDLPADLRPCVLGAIATDVRADHELTAFNVGRMRAEAELENYSATAPVNCAPR